MDQTRLTPEQTLETQLQNQPEDLAQFSTFDHIRMYAEARVEGMRSAAAESTLPQRVATAAAIGAAGLGAAEAASAGSTGAKVSSRGVFYENAADAKSKIRSIYKTCSVGSLIVNGDKSSKRGDMAERDSKKGVAKLAIKYIEKGDETYREYRVTNMSSKVKLCAVVGQNSSNTMMFYQKKGKPYLNGFKKTKNGYSGHIRDQYHINDPQDRDHGSFVVFFAKK